MKHGGRLAGGGGLFEELRRARLIMRHLFAIQEQHGKAELRGGVVRLCGKRQPVHGPRLIAAVAVATGIEHAEPELASGAALLGRGCKPAFGLGEILHEAKAAGKLITEPPLRLLMSGTCCARIPMRGLLQILGNSESLGIEALQERGLIARAVPELLQGCRRGRLRSRQPREVDLPEPRHRRYGGLLCGASQPAHRFNEALQNALAALIHLPEPQLRLRRAALSERAEYCSRFCLAAFRVRFGRALKARAAKWQQPAEK